MSRPVSNPRTSFLPIANDPRRSYGEHPCCLVATLLQSGGRKGLPGLGVAATRQISRPVLWTVEGGAVPPRYFYRYSRLSSLRRSNREHQFWSRSVRRPPARTTSSQRATRSRLSFKAVQAHSVQSNRRTQHPNPRPWTLDPRPSTRIEPHT